MAFKKLKFWFDKELAILLADKIMVHQPSFNKKRFAKSVDQKTEGLELKDRVEVICDELYVELGKKYSTGIQVLLQSLGPENEKETGMFSDFYWVMPIAKYVEKYGHSDFELSMQALAEVTKRNTSEYAIRPYLTAHTDKTLKMMKAWSKDKNFHLRRLACEGLRPRLPWASKLDIFIENPKKILPILEELKDDERKYVQKSVANCVNDIFKDNFEVGKALIEKWNGKKISPARKWIIKHALRNLIKKEDVWAMQVVE
ncbi:MAG: DNA alkylation repair protein [Saprospiraceae bacterium]